MSFILRLVPYKSSSHKHKTHILHTDTQNTHPQNTIFIPISPSSADTMTIRSVRKTTNKMPIIAMSITVPLVMTTTTTTNAAYANKIEHPRYDAPSIPSSLHHLGPECSYGTRNSECRRKLEGIDFEEEGSDNIDDDDMDDYPWTAVLPEDITITQHGISESWIDEMVWDKDAMDLFEQVHPRQSSSASHKRPGRSSNKAKESTTDHSNNDVESMYMNNEELPDSMVDVDVDADDGEKTKSRSSKRKSSKKSESGKKNSTSKSKHKKEKGSSKNEKDRSNLRKRDHSKSSLSKSASSSTSEDEWVSTRVPTESPTTFSSSFVDEPVPTSNAPSDLPSIVPSGAPSSFSDDDDDDDDDDVSPTQSPSTTSATTSGSDTEVDVPEIVVDIDDRDDDDARDPFASPGMLSAMVGLGFLVAGAVGLQSYFRRRNSSPSSSDVEDDDMETVDL